MFQHLLLLKARKYRPESTTQALQRPSQGVPVPVTVVESARLDSCEYAQRHRIYFKRRDEQAHVIVHQDAAVQPAIKSLQRLPQTLQTWSAGKQRRQELVKCSLTAVRKPFLRMLSRIALLGALVMSGSTHAAPVASALVLQPCEVPGVKEPLRCGDLRVPENWRSPQGRAISLHVVVVPALHPDPARPMPPLFDLAGGPGLADTPGAPFFVTDGSIHREHNDVVLVDQRGTGGSGALHCPELERAASLDPLYAPDAVRRCRIALQRNADLAQYTTANAARDMEALRRALGADKIDLSALSYGTRVAQAYLRLYPDHVHAAVLMGTVPDGKKLPLWHARNAQEVLDKVLDECSEDAGCHGAFPDVRREWSDLLRSFDGPAPVVDAKSEAVIHKGPLTEAFRSTLITTTGQRNAPFLIHEMAQHRFDAFLKPPGDGMDDAMGLYFSVVCMEDTGWITDRERIDATANTFVGTYRIDAQRTACKQWNAPKVDATRGIGSYPQVPILLLSGDMDYVTPTAWAREVAAHDPKARVVVIPALGHFPDGLSDMGCYDQVIADFLARGDATNLDITCIAGMKPGPFVVNDEPGGQ